MQLAKTLITGLLLLAFSWPHAAYAYDREIITEFLSTVAINTDSTIDVTEQITVISTGDAIKHGITRDFPTHYRDKDGHTHSVGFQVVDVLRDNKRIPYSVEKIKDGKRVYLGSPEIPIYPGKYTFFLTYRTDRQIGYFDDYDELYWNVTGNDWKFPIDHAVAIITPPAGTHFSRSAGYTGAFGERGKDYSSRQIDANSIAFETTRNLASGEGLTIAVAWPKGFVKQMVPSILDFIADFFSDYPIPKILILYFVCYFLLWLFLGREPKENVIVPLYIPPDNLSPATMNYVYTQFDDDAKKAFAATLVDMAVKKFIKIENKNGTFYFRRTGENTNVLNNEETRIAEQLFWNDRELPMDENNRNIIGDAFGKMRSDMTYSHDVYFKTSSNFVIAVLLTLVINATGFLGLLILGIDPVLTIFGGVIFNSIYWRYFKRDIPSAKGRKLVQKIEGFKMYLSMTEKDRLNKLTQQLKMTPVIFEKYLPYAIALGVENAWGEKFASSIKEGEYDNYMPDWYTAQSWSSRNLWNFSHSMTSDLVSAIDNIMPTSSGLSGPGDFGGGSGGSFGGGFSGGGRGGGGGGGF